MKTRLHLLLLLSSFTGCVNVGGGNRPLEGVSYGDAYNTYFISYADALNEYAKMMPVIGHDTEATWATSEVQVMRDSIAAGGMSVRECLAMTYRMQAMTAYGLTYESSVFGLYSDEGENAAYAMHSAKDFNRYYSIERRSGFQRDSSLCLLGDLSFFYSQIFAKLYNELEDTQLFSTEAFGFSMDMYGIVRRLQDKGFDSSDILKVQAVLDGSSFFHAYVPLIHGFCMSQEIYDRQYSIIIDAAHFFDRQRQRMLKACDRSARSVHDFLEKNFDDYVAESVRYRVTLLGFLTENIKAIDEARKTVQDL